MERVYFLLTGDGPELEAAKAHIEKIKSAQNVWVEFTKKHSGKTEYFHTSSFFSGVAFDPVLDTIPDGWFCPRNCPQGCYRPKKTTAPADYKEFKNLPTAPLLDDFGKNIGCKCVFVARRMLVATFFHAKDGERIILSIPIRNDGSWFIPTGPHEELTASRYAELTKKGGEL